MRPPHYSVVSCALLPHPSYARQLSQHPRKATGEIMILRISAYQLLDNKFQHEIPDRTVADIPCFHSARIFYECNFYSLAPYYAVYNRFTYSFCPHSVSEHVP